jgi:hypothetical protein
MPTRIRTSVATMNCSRVAIGEYIVDFKRVGRDWISDPVSEDVAAAANDHPDFSTYETDEEIVETSVDYETVDFTDSVEVERMLRSFPADDLVQGIDELPGIMDALLNAIDPDRLRDVVRAEVYPEDLVKYIPDVVPVLRNWMVANAGLLTQKRAAAMGAMGDRISLADGMLSDLPEGNPSQADKLELTDEQRSLLPALDSENALGAAVDGSVQTSEIAPTEESTDKPDDDRSDDANDTIDPLDEAIVTASKRKKASAK